MNIRVLFLRSGWLLFSTLFLYSCITIDKTLGDYLIPSDQDLTVHVATFDLPIDSRPTDSLQTNINDLNPYLLFGACSDPVFGVTNAGAVFQFLPWTTFSYGEHPEPVSLTLTLPHTGNLVLDKSQLSIPQHIYVHEITTDLSYKDTYNNALSPQKWNPVPISGPGQLYFGTDTIRISLSLDFARKLLSATQAEKDSVRLFLQKFKGLYLHTDLPVGIHAGRLNLADMSRVQMVLKYTLDGADSTVFYAPPYSGGMAFNTISHSNASLDPQPSKNIYYQGLAGYKPYIDFVALTHNIRTWAAQSHIEVTKLLISRAEMLLSYDTASDYQIINQYPLRLYPFIRTYTDSTAYYQPINTIYSESSDGNINRSKYHYSMNITSYLQSLLKKETVTDRDNAWLMETKSTIVNNMTGASVSHFFYTTYPLATFKGTATEAKPILKLTYVVLK